MTTRLTQGRPADSGLEPQVKPLSASAVKQKTHPGQNCRQWTWTQVNQTSSSSQIENSLLTQGRPTGGGLEPLVNQTASSSLIENLTHHSPRADPQAVDLKPKEYHYIYIASISQTTHPGKTYRQWTWPPPPPPPTNTQQQSDNSLLTQGRPTGGGFEPHVIPLYVTSSNQTTHPGQTHRRWTWKPK